MPVQKLQLKKRYGIYFKNPMEPCFYRLFPAKKIFRKLRDPVPEKYNQKGLKQ